MFWLQVYALSGLGSLLALVGPATPCLSQDPEVSRTFRLDSASPSARKWWHNHLDCTFHSYSERASRADCVVLLSRSSDADQGSDSPDYKVEHLLKSTDDVVLFGSDDCPDHHSLQLIAPYLALANHHKAARLYQELFLVHHRKTVERDAISPESQEHFRVTYGAYSGLRRHQSREEVREYFHRAAADIIHDGSGLCDLVLSDYRELGDWRFLENAARLARDPEVHEAYARAGLMYLMSAQQEGRKREEQLLYESAERHLSSVGEERSQFVAETRRIWHLFHGESEVVPKQ